MTDIINRVDANKNGVLEFREFVAMMASRITKESMESELRAAFKLVTFTLLQPVSVSLTLKYQRPLFHLCIYTHLCLGCLIGMVMGISLQRSSELS